MRSTKLASSSATGMILVFMTVTMQRLLALGCPLSTFLILTVFSLITLVFVFVAQSSQNVHRNSLRSGWTPFFALFRAHASKTARLDVMIARRLFAIVTIIRTTPIILNAKTFSMSCIMIV